VPRRKSGLMGWVSHPSGLTRKRRGAWGWAIAPVMFATSVVARLALGKLLAGVPFLTFYPAIMVTTLICGWRQGVLVLGLSGFAAWYFFLPPLWSFALSGPESVVSLLSFLVLGSFDVAMIALLVEAIRGLQVSVQTQENLLRELRHRVGNNMQLVASMLRLARRDIQDPTASDVLEQAAARVTSMELLHRRLHDISTCTGALELVLRDILSDRFRGMPVEVRLDICPEPMSLHQMTAIVLLVTEAATNAAKHAFCPDQRGYFRVELREQPGGRFLLTVRHHGPRIGAVPVEAPAGQRLGMHIIQALAGQLGGRLEVGSGPGPTLMVEFAQAHREGALRSLRNVAMYAPSAQAT
jgi:two-component sensor histidine kinase